MEFLTDLLGGGALGAIVGSIGAFATKALTMKHDRAMAELSIKEREAEQMHELGMADKQMERAAIETEGEISRGELAVFGESLKGTGNNIVDIIRAVVRPLITVYMLVLVSYLTAGIAEAVGGLGSVPVDDLVVLYKQIITNLLMITTIAVTWWFGARPVKL